MLRNTASMQQAWQASTAARSARASCTRHGVSSTQPVQPSGHGWHRSSLPSPVVCAISSSSAVKNKVGAEKGCGWGSILLL